MHYWQFLILFLGLPLVGLLGLARRWLNRDFLAYLGLLVLIALIFTVPLDNFAINEGIWSFNPQRFSGLTFLKIPLEEYLFYLLWIALTSVLTLLCWHGLGLEKIPAEDED